MIIQIDLNTKRYGIDKAINKLIKAKRDLVQKQCTDFVKKLADRGIAVAKVNSGDYKDYIIYEKKILSQTADRVEGIFIARKKSDIFVQWKTGGYDIDPLLMAEFGSGWLAYNPLNIQGVGQGTHPQQKHAFDVDGWWYEDEKGKHHSVGHLPTLPVYNAYIEMENAIKEVAKETIRL